jgi:nucleoside-diphosphate-sugar epimerase
LANRVIPADPKKELVDPAVIGTTGILKALKRSAPGVKRVVVTSSFASVLDEAQFFNPEHTFSEASWNPAGLDDIHSSPATAYRVSKTLAEKAAWAFVESEKPAWDLVTVTPPLVLGPVVHHLASLASINTSNERVVKLLQGAWKDEIPGQGPVSLWIDVRDLAKAHVAAFEKPEAGGKRLFTTAGLFSNSEIAAIVREKFPEFKDKVPGPEVKGGERPALDKSFKWNTEQTDKLLGLEWTSLEKSISDLVDSLKTHGV